jgi:hypothetical protein
MVSAWANEEEQKRSKKTIGPGRERYDKSKMSEKLETEVDKYIGTKVHCICMRYCHTRTDPLAELGGGSDLGCNKLVQFNG